VTGRSFALLGYFTENHTMRRVASLGLLVLALNSVACDRTSSEARKRIVPEYDKATGKLQLLKYDSNGDGKIDTWSYMDGPRVVRIEIDRDGDGTVDRWEYYTPDQKLEKVGFSRANDGKEDAWSYAGPDGSVVRIDVSTKRDGKVTRIERYEQNHLVAAEEDTDGDGSIDKWETYDGARLASVAFDTGHRGRADRRLVYLADGSARVEVDAQGDGHFVAASAQPTPTNPRQR
jgi:EF hand